MLDSKNKRWKKFIDQCSGVESTLPVIHSTRAYSFDCIMEENCIKPLYCPVYNEDLVYLFYGRPSYKSGEGANSYLEFDWPITFVFSKTLDIKVKRIVPFDSGAFKKGLYKDFFDRNTKLEDFDVEPEFEEIGKIIEAFYGNARAYFNGRTTKNIDIGVRQFEAQGVHELARLPGMPVRDEDGRRDERSSSIEVQIESAIDLMGQVECVILPRPYLDDKEIMDKIEEWKIKNILDYSPIQNTGSDFIAGQIYQLVLEYYESKGYI